MREAQLLTLVFCRLFLFQVHSLDNEKFVHQGPFIPHAQPTSLGGHFYVKASKTVVARLQIVIAFAQFRR